MIVIGLASLDRALRRLPDASLITISKPSEGPVPSTADRPQLDLTFSDHRLPFPGKQAATEEHVLQAIRFAREHSLKDIIVHCTHGANRSPALLFAVALGRLEWGRGRGIGETAFADVVEAPLMAAYRARSLGLRFDIDVEPNDWITAMIDEMFGFNGKLLSKMFDRYWLNLESEEREQRIAVLQAMAQVRDDAARAEVARRYEIPWGPPL